MLTLIIVIAVLFLPLMLIGILTVYQSAALIRTIQSSGFIQGVTDVPSGLASWVQDTPFGPLFDLIQQEWSNYAARATSTVGNFLLESIKSITENSLKFVFQLFIMIYTLYYFLKDGKNFLGQLMLYSPLGSMYEETLIRRFSSTVRATLKSTVLIGGIQGFLGGVLFFIAGIQGAFIWGVIMVILSIIPAVGSFLIWFPAGIIMLALGNIWQGVLILAFGSVVISMIDNVLRPPLVGKDIEMHPLIVLFATLGGLAVFGVAGFIIGPIIAALFLSVLSIYQHYFRRELEDN
jgi:predicted PurR-regulated permease PerM